MKRILITGEGSYIGRSFKRYVSSREEVQVDELDVRGETWKEKDFSSLM